MDKALREYLEGAPESTFQNMKREEAIEAYESMALAIKHYQQEVAYLRRAVEGERDLLRREVEQTIRSEIAYRLLRWSEDLAEGANDDVFLEKEVPA